MQTCAVPAFFPLPRVPQAKDIFARNLPVPEGVLRRHIDAAGPVAARYAALRAAERQTLRDTNRVRSQMHETHMAITQVRRACTAACSSSRPRQWHACVKRAQLHARNAAARGPAIAVC